MNQKNPIFPRSAIKLAQATAMLRSGAKLENEKLAISCTHLIVEKIYIISYQDAKRHWFNNRCASMPADLPLDTATQIEYLSKGMKPERLTMNCSGKHAGMLIACVQNKWSMKIT